MNIAELKGEKTVKTLAKHLLAEPSKNTPKTTQMEMEAALLRLNPFLSRIGKLEKGTSIVVPGNFRLNPERSISPGRDLAYNFLRRAEGAVTESRVKMKEQATQQAARTKRVLAWLKGDQAKELARQSPQLKEVFSSVASAGKTLPKELAVAATAEDKALDKVASALAGFLKSTRGPVASSDSDFPTNPDKSSSRPRRKSPPRTKPS